MSGEMERRRCPRTPLQADVEFRRKRETRYSIPMHDLSPHGARIASPERIDAGEMVWVQLPSLESLCSRVQWSSEWQSGVEFEKPMHEAVFAMIRSRLAPAND